ncbi:protein F37C4.5-like [Paramacrobiotus metropolitanus]|uniref:protein F37C4.5-like n=1 Tax=Paramacrobiotus metropolitanus TaxID=2943436 RepID=UPI002445F289|nr:protein F37C4.5-like [Paramacrobiotus metropolitanus]
MSANRKQFSASDAPISKVTVYRDRAEISRVLRFKAQPGEHEVVLQQLRTPIDLSSLRVEGRGPATITDVNLSNNYVNKSQTSDVDQKEKKLREELNRLEEQKSIEDAEEARLGKQQEFWSKCVESLATGVFTVKDGKSYPATAETYNNITEFLNFQSGEARKLDEKLREQRHVSKQLTEKIETAQRNLNECCYGSSRNTWDVLVSLCAEAEGELELNISYIVYGASWSPKYDVRVASDSKKLSIAYYGLITQNTNEDWVEIPICLSTAVPAVGGNIPQLGTKQISFKQPPPPPVPTQQLFGFAPRAKMSRGYVEDEMMERSAPMMAMAMPMRAEMATAVTRVVQDSGITTSFEIAKLTTVPSDGSEHKVTVGMLELQPHMQYKAVPKKAEMAFLEAKAVNSSAYPILPGPASIFFGSNFVATVDLKTVSPQEEFSCSLGVDPAIKIKYRPVRRFNEQVGLLNKMNVVTYVQEIEVNNTRSDAVHIVIVDQVPRSTEEKLKVTLIDPPLTRERPDAKGFLLNHDNNIEHAIDVKERSSYTWTVKYKLEYPSDKEIEETEVQGSD